MPQQQELEQVVRYLELKKKRWDAWKARGKNSAELQERTGAINAAAVVSWGFEFGEIETDEDENVSVAVESRDNDNKEGVYVSLEGVEGSELDDLMVKFPFLEVSDTYKP